MKLYVLYLGNEMISTRATRLHDPPVTYYVDKCEGI